MVQSSPQPEALGYNPNASNALSPYLGYSFSQAACQSSSPCMTEVSSTIQSLDINDENTPPPSVHAGNTKIIHSSGGQTSEENELALVKAELEATLRKLAQYEGQKADVPHTRPQLVKYNPTSRNLFPGKQLTAINPQAMLGCRHPSSAQVPAPPHPLPVEAASAELSPLHLPSPLGGVFPARDGFSSGLVFLQHSSHPKQYRCLHKKPFETFQVLYHPLVAICEADQCNEGSRSTRRTRRGRQHGMPILNGPLHGPHHIEHRLDNNPFLALDCLNHGTMYSYFLRALT